MKMLALDQVNSVLEKYSDMLIDKVRERDDEMVTLETAIDILDHMQTEMNELKTYNVTTRSSK